MNDAIQLQVARGTSRHNLFNKTWRVLDGPPPRSLLCHWCKTEVFWSAEPKLHVDHLDQNQLNIDPDNLVPSCAGCRKVGQA